jgi:hypothetical protein
MRNSPTLPIIAVGAAMVLAALAALSYVMGGPKATVVLNEIQIALAAWAFALAVYGTQGLLSLLLEGRELRPGRVAPRLTDPLSAAIVVVALGLFAIAVLLGLGIVSGWRPALLGLLAGSGSVELALLLIFYKEAFLGDEAILQERNDGVPW